MRFSRFLLVLPVLLAGCATSNSITSTNFLSSVDVGQEYVYLVDNQRPFHVNVTYVGDDGLTFGWSFPEEEEQGSIVVTGWAMDNSANLHNYFEVGEEVLSEHTSVWVSDYVFDRISKGEYVTLDTGEVQVVFNVVGSEKYALSANDVATEVDAIVLADEDQGTQKIWVLNSPDNPLILRMDLEFSVELFTAANGH